MATLPLQDVWKVDADCFPLLLFTVLEADGAVLAWLCITSPCKYTTETAVTLAGHSHQSNLHLFSMADRQYAEPSRTACC